MRLAASMALTVVLAGGAGFAAGRLYRDRAEGATAAPHSTDGQLHGGSSRAEQPVPGRSLDKNPVRELELGSPAGRGEWQRAVLADRSAAMQLLSALQARAGIRILEGVDGLQQCSTGEFVVELEVRVTIHEGKIKTSPVGVARQVGAAAIDASCVGRTMSAFGEEELPAGGRAGLRQYDGRFLYRIRISDDGPSVSVAPVS